MPRGTKLVSSSLLFRMVVDLTARLTWPALYQCALDGDLELFTVSDNRPC